MVTVTLSDQDAMRAEVVAMDHDESGALHFLKECLLPQLRLQQTGKIKGHLDGGKGSMR